MISNVRFPARETKGNGWSVWENLSRWPRKVKDFSRMQAKNVDIRYEGANQD
jgi:hypothetical protein